MPEPVVPPPDEQLRRIEAAQMLASWRCPHCHSKTIPIAARDGLVRTVEVVHERECPDWVDPAK